MIRYQRGGIHHLLSVFSRRGSVFFRAFLVACPCAIIAASLSCMARLDVFPDLSQKGFVFQDSNAWTAFTALLGFIIVFRTSQSYSRYWEGCTSVHNMRAEWFDACASLIAFCKLTESGAGEVLSFQHAMVRMFSMLHALALAELEDVNSDRLEDINAFNFEVIDLESFDKATLQIIKKCDAKVTLVFQWIQQSIVENIGNKLLSIPPPVLSRSFHQLANGMSQFHDALKLSEVPFPFPYAQTCDGLLLLHWLGTPFMIGQWTDKPWWAFLLSFLQIFIMWCLNFIAVEIENPFGTDDNDMDNDTMQLEMNRHLMLLIQPETLATPRIVPITTETTREKLLRRKSFLQVWHALDGEVARSARCSTERLGPESEAIRSSRRSSESLSTCGTVKAPDEGMAIAVQTSSICRAGHTGERTSGESLSRAGAADVPEGGVAGTQVPANLFV